MLRLVGKMAEETKARSIASAEMWPDPGVVLGIVDHCISEPLWSTIEVSDMGNHDQL